MEMADLLREETPVARKTYDCDACWAWDRSGLSRDDVTDEHRAVLDKAEKDKWLIHPGEKYRKCTYKDGVIQVYRAKLDMDDLIAELELYDDC